MSARIPAVVSLLAVVTVLPAVAQEKALNEGHPVRLADAFPIGIGEGSVLGTGSALVSPRGHALGLFQVDVQYGLLPRTQLSASTLLSTNLGDQGPGDLTLAAKSAFGPTSGPWPLLAAQLAVTLPSGVGSRSVDLELKGYATKSLVLGLLPLYLHVNASVEFRATGREQDDRLVVYHLAAGPSFTVPQLAAMTLVADVFVDQAVRRGERETIGMETGVRYRLTPQIAVHGAVGSEFAGPTDRAAFFARAGLSFDFTGPAFGAGSR